MVKEIAVITIDHAEAEPFERTYREITPIIRRQPGYHSDELLKVVENPDEYVLIIQWESVDAHQAFIESEDFKILADRWGPFQKEALVRHGEAVETSG